MVDTATIIQVERTVEWYRGYNDYKCHVYFGDAWTAFRFEAPGADEGEYRAGWVAAAYEAKGE